MFSYVKVHVSSVEDRKTRAQPRGSFGRNFKLFEHVIAPECIEQE